MDAARRKLRICLILVVLAAVVVGVIYYFTDVYGHDQVSEGTLVRKTQERMIESRPEGVMSWQEIM